MVRQKRIDVNVIYLNRQRLIRSSDLTWTRNSGTNSLCAFNGIMYKSHFCNYQLPTSS